MYNAIDVASYIVNRSIDLNAPVSNLKLQKLLYYVQAAKLVKSGERMFKEDICAWKYGPVVESVYHRFKMYANAQINEKITNMSWILMRGFTRDDTYDPCDVIMLEDQKIINEILRAHQGHDAMHLVRKTHEEIPWRDAINNNKPYISSNVIKEYYTEHEEKLYN